MQGVVYALILLLSISAVLSVTVPLAYRPRLSVVDWTSYNHHEPAGPGTYAFGYDIEDPASNNVQFRNEERHPNGTVTGSYGYVEPDGNVRIVHYVADHNGYRATEENSLKLSMLKPIRYPETPFFPPGAASHQQGNYNLHDQRTRPLDRFNKPVMVAHPPNLFVAHRIDNAPENYVYQPQAVYVPEYHPGFRTYVDPRRRDYY